MIWRAQSRWRKVDLRPPSSVVHAAGRASGGIGPGGGGQAPASALGYEAVAARAAFEAAKDDALDYFSPVSNTPGFPKALARTLQELRLAGVAADSLGGLLRSGPDLADLLDRVETLMSEAGASDRASLFATATKALTAT